MSYTKTVWVTGDVITATKLNNAEDGIEAAYTDAIRISQTFAIPDEVRVPSGDIDFIPGFYVSLATGQTAKLVACRHVINSGTDVELDIEINGSGATGFTSITVTTTPTTTNPADVTLNDGDYIQPVVTAVSGTPKNMTLSIFLDLAR